MSTGGASFTPRINPRPTPFRAADVIAGAIIGNVRLPFLAAAFTKIVAPAYFSAANAWVAAGYSEAAFFVAGTMAIHFALYFGINGFFLFCDVNGYLDTYKLHRTQRMGPSWKLIYRTWSEAMVGQFLIGPPTLWGIYKLFKYFGTPGITTELPDFLHLMFFYWLANLGNGHLFYWSHRLVHHPKLYRWIHKQHHTHIGTIGFSAEYANPIEQIVSNQGPTVIMCLLTGSHVCVWFVWLMARLHQTYEGHSGYCFYGTFLHKIGLTYSEGAAFHDFHHTGNRGNFGGPVYLDYFFGTMDAWFLLGGTQGYVDRAKAGNSSNALRKST